MQLSERLSSEQLVAMHQFKQTLPFQSVESKRKVIGKLRDRETITDDEGNIHVMNLKDQLKASLRKEARNG